MVVEETLSLKALHYCIVHGISDVVQNTCSIVFVLDPPFQIRAFGYALVKQHGHLSKSIQQAGNKVSRLQLSVSNNCKNTSNISMTVKRKTPLNPCRASFGTLGLTRVCIFPLNGGTGLCSQAEARSCVEHSRNVWHPVFYTDCSRGR